MSNQENKTRLIDTPAAKRSIFLTLMGIPMMFVASFGSENIVCTILAAIYVLALLVNGIVSFSLIVKMIHKANKND